MRSETDQHSNHVFQVGQKLLVKFYLDSKVEEDISTWCGGIIDSVYHSAFLRKKGISIKPEAGQEEEPVCVSPHPYSAEFARWQAWVCHRASLETGCRLPNPFLASQTFSPSNRGI